MGTNSSSKSCSIMGSSRVSLRDRYGVSFSFFRSFFARKNDCSGASFEVSQVLPKLLPGAVDVGLHRAEREFHDLRDLVVGIVLDVAQNDAGAVLGPEPGDRFFDRSPELARLQLLERRFAPTRNSYRCRPRAFRRHRVGRALDADGIDLPAA